MKREKWRVQKFFEFLGKEENNLQKKLIKTSIIIIVIIIILAILFGVIKVQNIILKKVYPTTYSEYVYKYAKEYEVDPILIFAIIKAESNFNPNVVSQSNAIGLMQLIESTAEEIARKQEIKFVEGETLFNPEQNIMLGTKYFSNLMKEYKNNHLLALTAYNAGIGNVKRWIEQGIIKEDGSDIENIPYKETNNYVRKIIRDYKLYEKLYK